MTYILGYFSVPAISILIALIIGVFTATAIACYFDLKSREAIDTAGLNKLPEGAEWARIPKKRLQAFRTSMRESSNSKEDELPLLTPKEPSTRSIKTPSKVAASRLDQEEKHKRMIEAVYIASGRAVPAHLVSTSTRTAVHKSIHPKVTVPATVPDTVLSDPLPVDKTQSLSDDDIHTMVTFASEISDDSTQPSIELPLSSDRKVPEPTPEQIERAALAFVREIEKTPASQASSKDK